MQRLRHVWDVWKQFGKVLGDFVGRVVMTIFYFTFFLPFGLASRLFRDPLECKDIDDVHWSPRSPEEVSIKKAQRLG